MKTIDITPTWTEILPLLLRMVFNTKTRDTAIEELRRMAEAADQWNAHVKTLPQES